MKKLFSFVCALVCAMSLSAKEFYLVPNSNWLKDNARFAIYAYHGTGGDKVETWVGMTAVEGATVTYHATVDDAYTTLIFCRMKPDKPENNWDNKWNQTGDLKDWGDNDCFTLTENSWGEGTWSKYGQEEVVVPTIQVAGSFFELVDGKWDIRDLTPAEDKSIASIKVTMEAGTYEFKVIKDGSWLGNNGTMERSNCTGWNFYGDAGNAKLKADVKGDYTFTWTYETNALSVTFPAATATDLIGADSDSKAVKIVRDGQLLIVRDGVTYNMMGSVVK